MNVHTGNRHLSDHVDVRESDNVALQGLSIAMRLFAVLQQHDDLFPFEFWQISFPTSGPEKAESTLCVWAHPRGPLQHKGGPIGTKSLG